MHSFFSSTSQSKPIRTPQKQTEIIIIGSDDENIKTSPTRSKRKAPGNSDLESFSSGSKKGKVSRSTAKCVTEDDSPLKSVPSSSLNRTITEAEAESHIQTNRAQKVVNPVSGWETGDDELLDIVDDSQVDDDENNPENILDTCPVCGAIFVDFCLSVSAAPPPLLVVHIHISLPSSCKRT